MFVGVVAETDLFDFLGLLGLVLAFLAVLFIFELAVIKDLATGGVAWGPTSTKSSSFSWALARA